MSDLKVLYQDKYITITDCYILIKKYYIPLMTSKTVMFNQMRTISIEDARKINKSWGIDANHLNNWFQYDPDRKNKNKFISIQIKNSAIRPAITPEDVDTAFAVLREHFAAIDRKSVMFHSNRDKDTELQQKEAHQMMAQQIQHEKHEKKLKEEKQDKNDKHETSQQQLHVKEEKVEHKS